MFQCFVNGSGGLEVCRSGGALAVIDVNVNVVELDAGKRLKELLGYKKVARVIELLLNVEGTEFSEVLSIDGPASLFVTLNVVCVVHVDRKDTWAQLMSRVLSGLLVVETDRKHEMTHVHAKWSNRVDW